MRFCHHCRKFNAGDPTRCRYCRAGLTGRLCPRNHVNPVDSVVAFCGECGEPLERECGAGRIPARPIALGIGVLMLFLMFIAILSSSQLQCQFFGMLIIFGLLVLGLRFAFGLLPAWARHVTGSVVRGLVGFVLGTGNKGKR